MLKFLHLSDLHVHMSPAKNMGVRNRLSYIKKQYPSHRLIITGDITDDGSTNQYINAWWLLVGGRDHLCPGNHDYGYAGNIYGRKRAKRYRQYLRKYSRSVEIITRGGATAVLIGLDSNLRTRNPFDFACGKIGLWQRWWLKYTLRKARRRYPDAARIVYFHHHPFDRGPWTGMKDGKKLMAILDNCELVLFGHKHKAEWIIEDLPSPLIAAAGKLSERDTVTEIAVDDKGEITLKEVPVIGE